jgi:hypothetical protein
METKIFFPLNGSIVPAGINLCIALAVCRK